MRTADDRRAALQRGHEAEQAAVEDYIQRGWRVLERNLRIGGAELDLVVEREGDLRFVEVKCRDLDDPNALESITIDKRRRLVRGAVAFLQRYQDDLYETACFDVVVAHQTDDVWQLDVLAHAFDV